MNLKLILSSLCLLVFFSCEKEEAALNNESQKIQQPTDGRATATASRQSTFNFCYDDLEPEDVAKISLDQMAVGKFLITPHEIVKKYIKIKSEDTDKWILGMRKLYNKFVV